MRFGWKNLTDVVICNWKPKWIKDPDQAAEQRGGCINNKKRQQIDKKNDKTQGCIFQPIFNHRCDCFRKELNLKNLVQSIALIS